MEKDERIKQNQAPTQATSIEERKSAHKGKIIEFKLCDSAKELRITTYFPLHFQTTSSLHL